MISRSHRFHGRGSLKLVYGRGQTVRTSWLVLRYLKNERREDYRTAVVVSRKVSKSAVVRNRIRRRIYELIRLAEPDFTGAYDLVLTVHNELPAKLPAAELNKMVSEVLAKAGIIPVSHDIVNTSKPALSGITEPK